MNETPVRIRRAVPDDAGTCGQICYDAFKTINAQHNFPPDLPSVEAGQGLLGMLFSHPGFYGVVAEVDGRIIGSNVLDERSMIAGIGPITIDPGEQNRGVGRLLMEAVINRAREKSFPGVRLAQTTFHSRSLSLYSKLGFQVREPLAVMRGKLTTEPPAGCAVRPATSEDIETCDRICQRVHGHNRSGELRDAIAHGTARVVQRSGRITGYATILGAFGHAVGETTEDIQALIATAPEFAGPGILVPIRNSELFQWCLNNGLRVIQPMNLMTIGLYNEPAGAYLPSILY
jgi:GNAT superfamily N-acetyltransferase